MKIVESRKAYTGENSFTIVVKDENGYRLDTYTVENLSSSDSLLRDAGKRVHVKRLSGKSNGNGIEHENKN
jgi:hypothetical protein